MQSSHRSRTALPAHGRQGGRALLPRGQAVASSTPPPERQSGKWDLPLFPSHFLYVRGLAWDGNPSIPYAAAPTSVAFLRERRPVRFTRAWHSFFDRSTPNVILRLIIMLAGVAVVSASVALTRATGLGTSPVSCFPATLSYLTPLTIGTWTFIMNVVFVLIRIALLRHDFNPVQLLQIPYVLVFLGAHRCVCAPLRASPWGTTHCKSPGALSAAS